MTEETTHTFSLEKRAGWSTDGSIGLSADSLIQTEKSQPMSNGFLLDFLKASEVPGGRLTLGDPLKPNREVDMSGFETWLTKWEAVNAT